jgi:hypothetical protein
MISYTIIIILTTLMFSSGTLFWIISMFTGKMERPILSLFGYLFWPVSILLIIFYVYLLNRYNSRKSIF